MKINIQGMIDRAVKAEIRRLRDLVELRTLERDEARDEAAQHLQNYESASAQATRFAERLGEQAREDGWPAVGAVLPRKTAWAHMMSHPQARYLARSTWTDRTYNVRGHWFNGECALVKSDGLVFHVDPTLSDWTFTRLPDAGQEK